MANLNDMEDAAYFVIKNDKRLLEMVEGEYRSWREEGLIRVNAADVDIVSVGNNPYSDLSRSVYVRAYSGRETIYKNNMNISTFTMGIPEIIDEILESVR